MFVNGPTRKICLFASVPIKRLDEGCKGQCKNWYIDRDYALFPLDRELLAKNIPKAELQEEFNRNVEGVIEQIRNSIP